MLPIIHEDTQMIYDKDHSLVVLVKDYETLKKTITHFIITYRKFMNSSDDKSSFVRDNTPLVVSSIDKCLYKFTQKHHNYQTYLTKVVKMNKVMLSACRDTKKLIQVSKLLNIKRH